jgi:acyl-CoA thioesterase-1
LRSWFIATWLLLVLAGGGCSQEASVAEGAAPTGAVEARAPEGPLVVFLGDSLTAGYGLTEDEAFPALLGAALREAGRPVRVVNAGVSGDTSAGGLRRLPWLLTQHPDVLVVALGANDGLRGLAVSLTEENLRTIVADAQRAGARVLLLGLRLPPNLGADYVQAFEAVYPRVARETGVPLVPFFLQGVGGVEELNQEDGIHPTAEGQRRIAATVLPYLRPLVPER